MSSLIFTDIPDPTAPKAECLWVLELEGIRALRLEWPGIHSLCDTQLFPLRISK